MKKQFHLTQQGVNELKQELQNKKQRSVEVAEAIKVAREQGDLSENAEYHAAKDEQMALQRRIQEIEHVLQNVEIIEANNGSKDKVTLGSTVTLEGSEGKDLTYTIVGSLEADPLESKISDESPIGNALLGVKKGEEVTISLPAGEQTFKVATIK